MAAKKSNQNIMSKLTEGNSTTLQRVTINHSVRKYLSSAQHDLDTCSNQYYIQFIAHTLIKTNLILK